MAGSSVDRALTLISRGGFGIMAAASIPAWCIFDVDGGQRAVMLNMFTGVEEKVRGEGTHLKVPWVMQPHYYTIRLRPKILKTTTGTKDMQVVTIHCRMLFRPEVSGLPNLHTSLGPDYDERVLPSVANEVLKSVIAQYNAEQLLLEREVVSREVRDLIVQRAKQFGLCIDDVAITHLTYGKEFAQAIEQKQVAEQSAEQQKFVVEQSEQERQATVLRSEGEAEAARLISGALQEHGTGLIDIRRIDAARDIADGLSKNSNIMYLPRDQHMMLGIGSVGGVSPQKQS